MRCILSVVLLFGLFLVTGCQSIGYYAQSVKGQWQLASQAKPINQWLADENVSNPLKQRLELARQIRHFASVQLSLPDNKSYTQYADLKRPYVVWNIFAASELSLNPYMWCYPVIGCQAYRGYFSKQPALELASKLKSNRYDVFLGGVKAYSTLGWFNDPLLNTFINYPKADLAGLIFHELAHQVVYVKNDTVFNESFATMVESKGVQLWLKSTTDESEYNRYKQAQVFETAVIELVLKSKNALDFLYKSGLSAREKRIQKAEAFKTLHSGYQSLKSENNFNSSWDRWFAQPLNNAHLVSIGAYYAKVKNFQILFEKANHDFERFFEFVKKLATFNKSDRERKLASFMVNKNLTLL